MIFYEQNFFYLLEIYVLKISNLILYNTGYIIYTGAVLLDFRCLIIIKL